MLLSTTNTEDTISEIPRVMQSGVIDHKQIWPFSWNPSVVGGFMTLFLSIRRRKMVAEWVSKSWVLLGFCKQSYIQRTLLTCGEEIAKNRRPTKDLTWGEKPEAVVYCFPYLCSIFIGPKLSCTSRSYFLFGQTHTLANYSRKFHTNFVTLLFTWWRWWGPLFGNKRDCKWTKAHVVNNRMSSLVEEQPTCFSVEWVANLSLTWMAVGLERNEINNNMV